MSLTYRHHIYEKHGGGKSIELKEIGPWFELRLYQVCIIIKLTIDCFVICGVMKKDDLPIEGNNYMLLKLRKLRVSLGAVVRLLLCDLEVTDSNFGNNLSACGYKATYIYPSYTPSNGSLVH